jgi:hypothetical protein
MKCPKCDQETLLIEEDTCTTCWIKRKFNVLLFWIFCVLSCMLVGIILLQWWLHE